MTPPLTEKHRKLLEKVYYDDKKTYGRDGLHHYLKQYYTDIPSLRQINDWLQAQKLQQLYSQTRQGGTTDKFKPEKSWNSISMDLIDFTNKPSKQYRYILVVIDNFSRYMITRKITAKEADKVAVALREILNEIKKKSKSYPKYVICDDGNEFKGDTLKLLRELGVEKRRTLPAQPFANGLVERANGKIKMLLAKIKEIHGGGWSDNLVASTKAYNEQYNRAGNLSPEQAVKLTGDDAKAYREMIIKNNTRNEDEFIHREPLKVGSRVRIKLAKGKLDKSSTPNWSSAIYKIGKVVNSRTPTVAPYYRIEGRPQDLKYTRNDVLPINKVEDIPKRKTAPTTRQKEQSILVDGARTRADKVAVSATVRAKRKEMKPPSPKKAPVKQVSPSQKKWNIEAFVGEQGKNFMVKWEGYKQPTLEPKAQLKKDLKGNYDLFVADFRKREKITEIKRRKGRG